MKKISDNAEKLLKREIDNYKRFIIRRAEFFSDIDDSVVINDSHIQMAAEEFNNSYYTNKRIIDRKKNDYISYLSMMFALIGMLVAAISVVFSFSAFELELNYNLLSFVTFVLAGFCVTYVVVLNSRKRSTGDKELLLNKYLNKWDDLESKLKMLYEKQNGESPRNIKELLYFFVKLQGVHDQRGVEEKFFMLLDKRNKIVHQKITRKDYNDIKESISDINEVLSLLNAVSFLKRGMEYAEKGEKEKAVDELNKAIDHKRDFVAAFITRGNIFRNNNEHIKAIEDFSKAIEYNQDNFLAYFYRGFSYDMTGAYNKAIADFSKAISLEPGNATLYSNRGTSYDHSGDFSKAIDDFCTAIRLEPDNAITYFNRGTSYYNKGDFDNAIADYKKSIDLNPNLSSSYNNLANILCKQKKYEEALELVNKAIELDKESAYYDTRCDINMELGHLEDAIKDAKQGIENILRKENTKIENFNK